MATKSFDVVYLDPKRINFERRGDTLGLTLPDGTHYPRVVLRSCFPVSEQETFLSVRDASGEGENEEEQAEIGIIEDWTALEEANRRAVAVELGLHYFVPRIQQVRELKDELGFLYWTVDTDKGPTKFVMRDSVVRYAREVAPNRWLLIDVNQSRYEIPDISALDRKSRNLVNRFLYL
jgi:hypothetical protein